MLNLNFVLSNTTSDLLTLFLPKTFRIFFLSISLVMIIGIMGDGGGISNNIGPLIIMIICLLCGCYYEAWIFNRNTRTIEQRFGLLFLFNRKTYAMDDLEAVKISGFRTGSQKAIDTDRKKFFQKDFIKLTLVTKQGSIHDIETLTGKNRTSIEKKALKLAEFCDASLVNEVSVTQ